jgi:antitoxin component YwqK of YwqJK toxin-antitoxin module
MSKMNFKISIVVFLFSNICNSQIIKKEFYNTGKLFRTFEVNKDSLKNGDDIHYFENGKISQKKKWSNGKLIDSIFTYNDKGDIVTKGYIDKKNLLRLYKNDVLSYEGFIEDDKLKGIVLYYKDENIVISKTFLNDKENGFGIILDDKSFKPKFIYEANNSIRDGVLINFHESGIIKSFRSKSLNSKNSEYFEFYPNGTIKLIGSMNNGAYDGYVYYFDDNGRNVKKIYYENGNVIEDYNSPAGASVPLVPK